MRSYKLTQIFLTIILGVMAAAVNAQTSLPGGFIKMTTSEIVWKDAENGIKNTVLFGDPNKPGLYVVRNIFPAGVMSTPHSHDQDRWVTVVKGTWYSGTDASWDPKSTIVMPEGSIMFHPANAVHFDGSLKEPVEVQIIGMGPVKTTYVYPSEGRYGKPHKLD
ncbi:cupin domain-containing protein [Polynucleobacter rarus]|jgi:quercetin dioxygenase-like cupin family protein|uniref:cupin domain-containing protein n=1 Tax=Polynucleobacter rarus TaxID=556055 RepID=UPI000D3ED2B1|nr:cupin domain-containing protein [Polynucleobacter rarus]